MAIPILYLEFFSFSQYNMLIRQYFKVVIPKVLQINCLFCSITVWHYKKT